MKQILQSLKNGSTKVSEVPTPMSSKGSILIESSNTLVSVGTEKMLVEFGKAGWVEKALKQPDKVKMVLDKIKTDGLKPTIEAVFNKLDQPLPLGYCNVGKVIEMGHGVDGFSIGDRVVSNGKHAEIVNVPFNLCAKIPDNVSNEEAAFTVIGAISLQGIRLAKPTLGEAFVVIGLGLIGLITVQLLRANGCRVLGADFDKTKLAMAKKFGAETVDLSTGVNFLEIANKFSRGRGVDAVIIAAATKSSEPIHQAANMCRKNGRIILVGVTGLEISREDFFKKEITFQVSSSYGPGRYDPNYEEKGQDYPIGYVRWTEQRNFEAILDMLALGVLDFKALITHQFEISEAHKAYELVIGKNSALGILLNYPGIEVNLNSQEIIINKLKHQEFTGRNKSLHKLVSTSFIGAGNYATGVLIPAFKKAGAKLKTISSNSGVTGSYAAKKYGFEVTTTNSELIFSDKTNDAVVITTRHDSHAKFILDGLVSKKHIFVEKPLAINMEELNLIKSSYTHETILMVGFNRRFSPQVQKIKELIQPLDVPKSFVYTVNAGFIPSDHWTQDFEIGGGRIIGEVCHFIDLLRFLVGKKITNYHLVSLDSKNKDTISINLNFADGSIGTILYFANGSKSFPKERLEVFVNNSVLQLDNFRKLRGFGWNGFKKMNLWKQDKGQNSCTLAFINAIEKNLEPPIPIEEILEVSEIAIELSRE